MRISALSDQTGISIPTLKYYLREGLLHAGHSLGPTSADYDESHVERLRLIRTLAEVGGLRLEAIRAVVAAIESPPSSRHELLGTNHEVLAPPGQPASVAESTSLAARLGWHVHEHSPATRQLALALERAQSAGWSLPAEQLDAWALALRTVAESDVSTELATSSPADALTRAITGNVLTDPVVIALRRLAQEAVSAERFGDQSPTT